jgi:hypothetical protein
MDIDERIQNLHVNIESLHASVSELHEAAQRHDSQIAELIAAGKQKDKRMGEIMEAIARLLHIAEIQSGWKAMPSAR